MVLFHQNNNVIDIPTELMGRSHIPYWVGRVLASPPEGLQTKTFFGPWVFCRTEHIAFAIRRRSETSCNRY